ncbi:hypothetical protein V8E51_009354 [Hyaloscypha variabilis]|jgi:hypothetical protein
MADHELIQKLCKCSMIDCKDIGGITFATMQNRFERPTISDLIRFKRPDQETQASGNLTTQRTRDSQEKGARDDVQIMAEMRRSTAVENHLCWLRNKEVKPWNERAIWVPSGSNSWLCIEDIIWGQTSTLRNPTTHNPTPTTVFWDELGSQAFEHALRLQDQSDSSGLSHIELCVQGHDAHGNRLRVQRTLKVKLETTNRTTEQGKIVKTTMELKRTLAISSPEPSSVLSLKPKSKELYQDIVELLAQHEVDKALDERNHYLREVFWQNVDHVRTCRNTIAGHKWTYQKPEIRVRGPDGITMTLKELRRDFANGDDEVVLTHEISIEQVRGEKGKDHLFDLPGEGCESERRIRQARWTISSAIDKCVTWDGG